MGNHDTAVETNFFKSKTGSLGSLLLIGVHMLSFLCLFRVLSSFVFFWGGGWGSCQPVYTAIILFSARFHKPIEFKVEMTALDVGATGLNIYYVVPMHFTWPSFLNSSSFSCNL